MRSMHRVFSETSGIIDELESLFKLCQRMGSAFGDSFITFEMEVKFADSASGWKSSESEAIEMG